MLRRDFLGLSTGTAAEAVRSGVCSFATVEPRHTVPSAVPKLDRIAISTWSLHNFFPATRRSDFDQPGPMLALLDFPEMIVEKYKVHHFEFCTTHFASTEPVYVMELEVRADADRFDRH